MDRHQSFLRCLSSIHEGGRNPSSTNNNNDNINKPFLTRRCSASFFEAASTLTNHGNERSYHTAVPAAARVHRRMCGITDNGKKPDSSRPSLGRRHSHNVNFGANVASKQVPSMSSDKNQSNGRSRPGLGRCNSHNQGHSHNVRCEQQSHDTYHYHDHNTNNGKQQQSQQGEQPFLRTTVADFEELFDIKLTRHANAHGADDWNNACVKIGLNEKVEQEQEQEYERVKQEQEQVKQEQEGIPMTVKTKNTLYRPTRGRRHGLVSNRAVAPHQPPPLKEPPPQRQHERQNEYKQPQQSQGKMTTRSKARTRSSTCTVEPSEDSLNMSFSLSSRRSSLENLNFRRSIQNVHMASKKNESSPSFTAPAAAVATTHSPSAASVSTSGPTMTNRRHSHNVVQRRNDFTNNTSAATTTTTAINSNAAAHVNYTNYRVLKQHHHQQQQQQQQQANHNRRTNFERSVSKGISDSLMHQHHPQQQYRHTYNRSASYGVAETLKQQQMLQRQEANVRRPFKAYSDSKLRRTHGSFNDLAAAAAEHHYQHQKQQHHHQQQYHQQDQQDPRNLQRMERKWSGNTVTTLDTTDVSETFNPMFVRHEELQRNHHPTDYDYNHEEDFVCGTCTPLYSTASGKKIPPPPPRNSSRQHFRGFNFYKNNSNNSNNQSRNNSNKINNSKNLNDNYYKLGESARSPSHMISDTSNNTNPLWHNSEDNNLEDNLLQRSIAFQCVDTLSNYSCAFVKRSDGNWTYSMLMYRSFERIKNKITQQFGETEECMTFVMNEKGSTKVIGRSKWGKYVRVLSDECPKREMVGLVEKRRSLEEWERVILGRGAEDDGVEKEGLEDVPRDVVVSLGRDCLDDDDDDDEDGDEEDLFHEY